MSKLLKEIAETSVLLQQLEAEKESKKYWHKVTCVFGSILGFTYTILGVLIVTWWLTKR